MHATHIQTSVNLNYGQLGGGTASQPLAWIPDYSTGITSLLPWGSGEIQFAPGHAQQAVLPGPAIPGGLHVFEGHPDVHFDSDPSVHQSGITTRRETDRTHHIVVSATYELPFGKGKPMVTHGVGAAVLGGWSLNGIFNHYSGAPFTCHVQRLFLQLPR